MRTPLPDIAGATASEAVAGLAFAALLSIAGAGSTGAFAADARGQIYRCTDANGKRITSDRPVRECQNSAHDELNPDGSLKRVVPPPMTDDERAEAERRDREEKVANSAKNDAIRRDRNLMQRFPDEAAHRKARAKALDEFSGSVKNYEARIGLLTGERKKLKEEAEFYGPPPKQPMPANLKQRIDANDASLEAQNGLVQNQQTEITRINALYDAELARLKKLWAGAPAGSLGPLPGPQSAALPAASKTTTR
ncbi:MAG: DUF4124 domain-containing protein [Caldimonas sp.]